MKVMTASKFVEKAIDIAKNYKTMYISGCFGAPMTDKNKDRYSNSNDYNQQHAGQIRGASPDTFGFDCVCLIKGILWGWCGRQDKTYGGAAYKANGVPDIGANAMIEKCQNVSESGWEKMLPGEAVWMKGHIGIYIGNGLAVECTPKWKDKVQITAVGNIGGKAGYETRTWTRHGRLPWVEYEPDDSWWVSLLKELLQKLGELIGSSLSKND